MLLFTLRKKVSIVSHPINGNALSDIGEPQLRNKKNEVAELTPWGLYILRQTCISWSLVHLWAELYLPLQKLIVFVLQQAEKMTLIMGFSQTLWSCLTTELKCYLSALEWAESNTSWKLTVPITGPYPSIDSFQVSANHLISPNAWFKIVFRFGWEQNENNILPEKQRNIARVYHS